MNLGHLDFDIVSDLELRISDFASLGIFTTVKRSLQINLFMQNKPNFRKSQMNVTSLITADYDKRTLGRRGKNEPKTNPIKANKMPKRTQYKAKQTQFLSAISVAGQRQKNAAEYDD